MKKSKDILRDLATQRTKILFELALLETKRGRLDLARRYVDLIIRISRKAQVRPLKYIRRGYCRRCKIPLIPGLTSRVRVRSEGKGSRVVVTCLQCGWKRRFMIKIRRP